MNFLLSLDTYLLDRCVGLFVLVTISVLLLRINYAIWQDRRVAKRGCVLVHVPIVWTLRSLFASANELQRGSTAAPGYYVPARPHAAIGGFKYRLKCAWLAFSGRCDLVQWPEGQ